MKSAASLISALAILMVGILPALITTTGTAYAGEVTSRSINMSSSLPGNVTGGTGVTYTISWTPSGTTPASIKEAVVQFCDDSPIPTDTACSYPQGFALSSSTTLSPTFGGGLAACTFSSAAAQVATTGTAVYNTGEFTDSTGCAQTSGTADTITLSGVTNPTYACTTESACQFYARIYTYSTAVTFTTGYVTSLVDDGGVALSTSTQINIYATVQETINFCVYADIDTGVGTAGSGTCANSGTTSAPNITLGTGTNPTVLSSSTLGADRLIDFDLATNASKGVNVQIYGNTLTDSQSSTIPFQTTAGPLTTGSSLGAFGMWLTECAAVTSTGTGFSSTASSYELPTSMSTAPVTMVQTSAPDASCTSKLNYNAVAGTTTPSGVYSSQQQLIATATFQ